MVVCRLRFDPSPQLENFVLLIREKSGRIRNGKPITQYHTIDLIEFDKFFEDSFDARLELVCSATLYSGSLVDRFYHSAHPQGKKIMFDAIRFCDGWPCH